eukprot:2617718-Prymnesium_polylepis.1
MTVLVGRVRYFAASSDSVQDSRRRRMWSRRPSSAPAPALPSAPVERRDSALVRLARLCVTPNGTAGPVRLTPHYCLTDTVRAGPQSVRVAPRGRAVSCHGESRGVGRPEDSGIEHIHKCHLGPYTRLALYSPACSPSPARCAARAWRRARPEADTTAWP